MARLCQIADVGTAPECVCDATWPEPGAAHESAQAWERRHAGCLPPEVPSESYRDWADRLAGHLTAHPVPPPAPPAPAEPGEDVQVPF